MTNPTRHPGRTAPESGQGIRVRRGYRYPFAKTPEALLDADVPDRAVRLWALLDRYAGDDGEAWPSRSTLARRLRCSVDSIDRAVTALETSGWLEVERRPGRPGEGGRPSVYTLLLADEQEQAPGRTDAAGQPQGRGGGSRTAAAGGSRTAAAQNESQGEREPGNERGDPPLAPPVEDAISGEVLDFPAPSSSGRSLSEGERAALERVPARHRSDVLAVFRAWCEVTTEDRPRQARLDGKVGRGGAKRSRAEFIAERLAEDWPVADLCDAARGWVYSPHHRGVNDTGTVYDDLTLLLRDAEHIERFRDLWRSGPRRPPSRGAGGGIGPGVALALRTLQEMDRERERAEAR